MQCAWLAHDVLSVLLQGYFQLDMWGETQSSFKPTEGTCGILTAVTIPSIDSFKGVQSQVRLSCNTSAVLIPIWQDVLFASGR